MNILQFILALTLLLPLAGLAADDQPAPPQNFTHRITGLFSPDRETALRAALEKVPGVALVSVDFDHAEGVFSYDPAIAFKGTKPDDITKRFDELLRNATHSTLGIAPLIATPREKLTRIEIAAVGCDCKACGLAAYEIVAKIEGVAQAAVNFHESKISALIDPEKTNRAALEDALKKREVQVKAP